MNAVKTYANKHPLIKKLVYLIQNMHVHLKMIHISPESGYWLRLFFVILLMEYLISHTKTKMKQQNHFTKFTILI